MAKGSMATADPETEVTETEATAETPAGPQGGARPRPTYAAERVQELPEDLTAPKTGARPDPKLIEALQVAMGDPGQWYCVGTYQSKDGARAMLKRMKLAEGDAR